MSKIRSIAAGAAWIYGGQLATITIQFAYAAVTSRAVNDVGFGIYSIALAVSALMSLVAGGGLSQAAGRMLDLTPRRVSAIAFYGLLLGMAAAAILPGTADIWAAVWSAPNAAGPTRLMAVTVFFAPFFALSTGLLRRQNRYGLLEKLHRHRQVKSLVL
jgi:O-antigen/teichoic acid export membrane protein